MNKTQITHSPLRAVDFFCGAGGVSCGFRDAGIEVIGGIDINPSFRETYEKNNNAPFFERDVSNMKVDELMELVAITKKDDNLIFVGCSPCQYYSNLKSDKSKSKNSRLLLDDFEKFVSFYKPGFVFIENVPGLETKAGSPLDKFKRSLQRQGYKFDDEVVNAKYFDVPQNRRRYILIASRLNSGIKLPEQNKKGEIPTVEKAIGNYKQFPVVSDGYVDESGFQHSVAKLSELNLQRVKQTPKNGGSRMAWENNPELQLECYKRHDGHRDVYGRLSWKKPSSTITTRFIYTSTGRYSHPEQDRGLSLREGATLQSFPTNYRFYSNSQGDIATMIGNAVPPKLAKAIGITIKQHWIEWQLSRQKREQ
jgi:DNA (cytosine-5)-methyltransferase 1